jgi:surface antigen
MPPILLFRLVAVNTMTVLPYLITAAAALCLGLSGAADAAGRQAATEGMPVTKFSDDDRAIMMTNVNQALRADKDGETLDWKNDKTPASGSVTALNRLEWNGMQCRRLRIHNAYGDLKAQGVYKFCEKPAGKWKLVGPDGTP